MGVSEVARVLGMNPSHLTTFVDGHPNPSIEVLETVADEDLNESEKGTVGRWLEAYTTSEDTENSPGGDPRGLMW